MTTFQAGDTITITCFGITSEMTAIGRGEYPYDCTQRDKHPDAMIFRNDEKGSWVAEVDLLPTDQEGHYTL